MYLTKGGYDKSAHWFCMVFLTGSSTAINPKDIITEAKSRAEDFVLQANLMRKIYLEIGGWCSSEESFSRAKEFATPLL